MLPSSLPGPFAPLTASRSRREQVAALRVSKRAVHSEGESFREAHLAQGQVQNSSNNQAFQPGKWTQLIRGARPSQQRSSAQKHELPPDEAYEPQQLVRLDRTAAGSLREAKQGAAGLSGRALETSTPGCRSYEAAR